MSFVKFIGNFLRPSFYAGHYATISSSVNKQLLAGSPLPLFKMMVIVGTIGYTTEYIGIGRKYYFYYYYYYFYYYYFLMIYYDYDYHVYYLFLFYTYIHNDRSSCSRKARVDIEGACESSPQI